METIKDFLEFVYTDYGGLITFVALMALLFDWIFEPKNEMSTVLDCLICFGLVFWFVFCFWDKGYSIPLMIGVAYLFLKWSRRKKE